jgi:hypothetical protein
MVLRGNTSERARLHVPGTSVSPWQNPFDPFDVSGSDGVGPIDVLLLINSINRGEKTDLRTRASADAYYYDVDGDALLTPLDVLTLVNAINRTQTSGEVESSGGESSTEDSSFELNWLWQDLENAGNFLFGFDHKSGKTGHECVPANWPQGASPRVSRWPGLAPGHRKGLASY